MQDGYGTGATRERHWLVGGGEMGKLVRAMDWRKTPLGPSESWPQSLRTTVSLTLASNFPISLAWGPGRVQIYNDGYRPFCGAKHPVSMGQDFRECWATPWPVIGAVFDSALRGESRYVENQWMFLDRHGYQEETCFTFSFSPIRDESGEVGGLFHPVTEVTGKMLAERRIRTLRDIAARGAHAHSLEEALIAANGAMAEARLDLPFATFYRMNGHGTAIPFGAADSSARSGPPGDLSEWLLRAVEENRAIEIDDLEGRFGAYSCEPHPEAPHTAVLLPLSLPGSGSPSIVLAAGVSSRLPLDESYRAFFDLLGGTVSSMVASACAYAEERERAEALAELDRSKTAFFSNVSQEFRTPLTLILGPIEDELAERAEPLPAERHARLETAHRNSLRLLKLVNTLLDFSRIEAGRIQAHYQETDLASYTAELASGFSSAMEKGGLAFAIDCPPLSGPVYVDRSMWEKIVLNLLSNAFKHTFHGTIRIALEWLGETVQLTVADTGVGIPESELPRVFERFHRVLGSKSRSHEGTGIGLALVQELVRVHGGSIGVESCEGAGTTFRAIIKTGRAHLASENIASGEVPATTAGAAAAYVADAQQWLAETQGAEPGMPAPEGAKRSRVLWADDNADMREYVRRLLAQTYDVITMPNGLEAVREALANPPDLVLSDAMMPGLDGFGLLRALRADERTRTIPVILLSARAGEEASVEGIEAGADDYLVKPFAARELLARVGTHLRLAGLRRESAAILEQRAEERRYAEVHAGEERLRDHARAIDLCHVIIRDMDNRILVWTRGDERLYGFSQEEAIGKTSQELLKSEFPEPLERIREKLLESGSWEGEIVRFTKDGRRLVVASSWGVLYAGGQPARIVETVADVTELKTIEAALIVAQKRQAVGTLAEGIAHDFNNLLTAINGNAEFAADDLPPDHPVQEYLTDVRAAGARASALVRQILTFSRPQEEQQKSIQLRPVVEEALKLLRSTLPAMIEIVSNFEPGAPDVIADASQVHQIVMNLGTNALHAMAAGGLLEVRLTVMETGSEPPGAVAGIQAGTYVRIAVSDSGSGMDRATLDRIFDPFFTTKAPGKGTGLGLAVVHGIMRSHRGVVQVESRVGAGTTFYLYFPAAPAVFSRVEAPTVGPPRGEGQHILCIDDERSVLSVMARGLERLGYRVSSYSDASNALIDFRANAAQFDAVVTDYALRGMSGLDLAVELRARRPDIRILLMSGHMNGDVQERVKRLGINQTMLKPSGMTELGIKVFNLFHS